jgi:hypothetical protein
MTYAIPGPPAKTRPTVVRVAVFLLWSIVALQVIGIALGFVPTPELDRALDEFYEQNPPPAGTDTATAFGSAVGIAIAVVVAVVFAVLAIFVGKGSQPARITTWVFGGIVALCQGCLVTVGLAAPALLSSMTGSGDPNAERAAEEAQVVLDNTPVWLTVATTAIGVLSVLALIVAIILLAVPAANEYFRKTEEIWVPPTTGAGGGFPQYPPTQPPTPPTPPTQG